jgi:hypothetical protein
MKRIDQELKSHKRAHARFSAGFRYPFELLTILDLIGTRSKASDQGTEYKRPVRGKRQPQ